MCDEAFTDPDGLVAHTEEHEKVHFFVCAECRKIFTSESHLDEHLETHNVTDILYMDESKDGTFLQKVTPSKRHYLNTEVANEYEMKSSPERRIRERLIPM